MTKLPPPVKQEYMWLIERADDRGLFGAAFMSMVVHAIVFAVLATTSIFYPVAGDAEKLSILWHFDSSAPAEAANPGSSTSQEKQSSSINTSTAAPPVQDASLPTEPAQEPGTDTVQILHSEQEEAPSCTTEKTVAAESTVPTLLQAETSRVAKKAVEHRGQSLTGGNGNLATLRAEQGRIHEQPEPGKISVKSDEPMHLASEKAATARAEQKLDEGKGENQRVSALNAEEERMNREKEERAVANETEREWLTAEKEKANQERLAKEHAERKRLTALKLEQERLAKEKTERERVAAESSKKEKIAAIKAARQKAEQARLVKEMAETSRLAALKSARDRDAEEQKKREKDAMLKAAVEQRLDRERAESKRTALKPAEKFTANTDPPIQRQIEPSASQGKAIAVAEEKPRQPVLTKLSARKTSPNTDETAGTSSEAKGIVSSRLRGDLKLQFTGDDAIKVTVKFKPYPIGRRNRPMTLSESRRVQKVTPIITKTAQNIWEAVIEIAEAGIYDFIMDRVGAESASAEFTLKLYEDTGRMKIKPLGTKVVGTRTVIVKVLMPEGILWDDTSAFSGNMEDSTSVTRFNSETGLIWKEYKE